MMCYFFIYLESRKVEDSGITYHPNEAWMKQIAGNVTIDERDSFEYLLDMARFVKVLTKSSNFGI